MCVYISLRFRPCKNTYLETYTDVQQLGNLYIFACIHRYTYIMAQHYRGAFIELIECMAHRK